MSRARDIYDTILKDREKAIDFYIKTKKSEDLFLDFKRSADDGKGEFLHNSDRKNLEKGISGFGNSEGGVIVWGVSTHSTEKGIDVAQSKYPIQNPEAFTSKIESCISGCTIPPHSNVVNSCIKTTDTSGYVVTLIQKSNDAPHQCHDGRYYIRAGSSFSPAPHSVLSGMFGRRPQPNVFHNFYYAPITIEYPNIEFSLGITIANGGPGIAYDSFMHLTYSSVPTGITLFTRPQNLENMNVINAYGVHFSSISKADQKIPPKSYIPCFLLDFTISEPLDKDIIIEGVCGCRESNNFIFTIHSTKNNMEKHYQHIIKMHNSGKLDKKTKLNFVGEFLNLEEQAKKYKNFNM